MTGDPRRDHEATSHHWGGTDQPIEDEYAAHQRAEAEKAELERAWAAAHEEAEAERVTCGRPLAHWENPHVSTPCGRPLLHDGDCHPVQLANDRKEAADDSRD